MKVKRISTILHPIETTTMADVVELRLREYLKEKSFKPGDSLPGELELSKALNVSRNVVREALSRLRMLGLIETRKKRGMILGSPDILGTFERVLDPLIIDKSTLQDIFELRLVLEMGLADVLYLKKTDENIAELESIAQKENIEDKAFRVKGEIAFHGKLYEITGNDTLKRFQIMLMPIFWHAITLEEKTSRGKVSHADLVNILKKGNKDEFRAGMFAHLKPHFDRLKNNRKKHQ